MNLPHRVRIAKPVAEAVRDLPAEARAELHEALLRAAADPYAWPQADRYDLDETVRVITTDHAIAHYAIVHPARRLWVFAVTTL
ncbi:hypothetical protein [Streptomyces sp. TLI_171]|uniref:hypothetical protein n=1 Tax=Streptomyces sp. TLI_171 TaxID=1938859 RepID=UPI000C1A6EFF|nr:hypothetical protein [Streptomyces sp. TLI_171]RKE23274.1 hypothetical protein BX266_6736 [Streptomyces sp. TLI_171]